MTAGTWIKGFESEDGSLQMEHLNGVPWHEAQKPRRFHRCVAQTHGYRSYFDYIERCACGAIRFEPKGSWINRNKRTE